MASHKRGQHGRRPNFVFQDDEDDDKENNNTDESDDDHDEESDNDEDTDGSDDPFSAHTTPEKGTKLTVKVSDSVSVSFTKGLLD
jgi:hypothetical protein